MSFAVTQNATGVFCQQRYAAKPRNVVVAAHRPAAAEHKQPSPLARIGGATLGAAAAALLMVRAAVNSLICSSRTLDNPFVQVVPTGSCPCIGLPGSGCQGPSQSREGCTGGDFPHCCTWLCSHPNCCAHRNWMSHCCWTDYHGL